MKRKYADARKLTHLNNKEVYLEYVNDALFEGYISLICFKNILKPVIVEYKGECICLTDSNYYWMLMFPKNEYYCLMTFFDNEKKIIQYYFDIHTGIKLTENGIPYYDDLYLDIAMVKGYGIDLLDEDELALAYKDNTINKEQFDFAYKVVKNTINKINNSQIKVLDDVHYYLDLMLSNKTKG